MHNDAFQTFPLDQRAQKNVHCTFHCAARSSFAQLVDGVYRELRKPLHQLGISNSVILAEQHAVLDTALDVCEMRLTTKRVLSE